MTYVVFILGGLVMIAPALMVVAAGIEARRTRRRARVFAEQLRGRD